MTKDFPDLPSRMRENLAELDQVVERVGEGWHRAQQSSDDFSSLSTGAVRGPTCGMFRLR